MILISRKNQADSDENKGTGYGKSSSNVATNVSNTSNTVVASLSLLQFLQFSPLVSQKCHLACIVN